MKYPVLILILSAAVCGYSPQRAGLKTGEANAPDWQTLQQKKGPVKYRRLNTGSVRVPTEGMLNTDHPVYQELKAGKTAKDRYFGETIWVDVYSHVIEHPAHGTYLIDGGLSAGYRKSHPGGDVDGLLAVGYILASKQKTGQHTWQQLTDAGLTGNLKGVIFTHLHGDHTPGIQDFPVNLTDELRFITGAGDTYHNIHGLYHRHHLDNVKRLDEVSAGQGADDPLLGKVLDFFGDGSVWLVFTPGHSGGHLSVIIFAEDGPRLLTGDASHTRFGFEQGIEPGWVDDRDEAVASLRALRDFAAAQPGIKVIYGHEL